MTMQSALEPGRLRRGFGSFPTGVTRLAAEAGGGPAGRRPGGVCPPPRAGLRVRAAGGGGGRAGRAPTSFVWVPRPPPMVSVCVAHLSTTWPVLRRATRLGVSVLGAHQEHVGRRLSA